MFSSALKSFTSNISSNYTISPHPSSTSGPWKIFDAKRKQTGKTASVFVFDKKTLDAPGGGLGGRGGSASLKRAHEEVVDRLKREAGSLARLRHPSILELVEPVEETRSGGLMFATELVTASLASLLHEKDEQERTGGVGGRGSRYIVEDADGTRHRRELEIDELDIQKGLLQLGKGLEFLHESAGLVHGNLTPEAVLVNAKGDWKIAGLGFCGPHEASTTAVATNMPSISLSEVLNHDPRLPRTVQLDLDYASPDFVLDNTLATSADMFSLGLLIVAMYNSPHVSPLSTSGSISNYKRLFSSSTSIPTQSNNFLVPSSRSLPPKLTSDLLPRLITRRAAQRLSARELQDASYFDNILVSTIRFLDSLPAKTAQEKAAFMRGLPRITPQFPKSVLEKKVLPALLEEMKDKDLLAPILTNAFAIVNVMPTGKRAFSNAVVPKLRDVFISNRGAEKDASKEAGLMIVLENMQTAAENSDGKAFHEDILPIILLALDSTTHGLVDVALGTLPSVLPVLDFTTIKNELFPAIASVFAKTSSLNIKIRGLEAFYTLCGGPAMSDTEIEDDLNGIGVVDKKPPTASSSAILDKFTVQEKVVPLLKGIKTKEPGVMMAALKVFKQVGEVADSDFLAMDVLPILWSMSLGPLLNLQQFQAFMALIKKLSSKIEREQTRKLKELSGSNVGLSSGVDAGRQLTSSGPGSDGLANREETDFATLVSGRKTIANGATNDDIMNDWGVAPTVQRGSSQARSQSSSRINDAPTFAWQTSTNVTTNESHSQAVNTLRASNAQQLTGGMRSITPDQTLSSFAALTPTSPFSQPLQPMRPSSASNSSPSIAMRPAPPTSHNGTLATAGGAGGDGGLNVDWSAASRSTQPLTNSFGATPKPANGLNLPQPPMRPQAFGQAGKGIGLPPQQQQQQRTGLDRYESLL